jgi:hypothetical protein
MANTPVRTVRVDDPRWHAPEAEAAARRCSVSYVVRDAIDAYLGDVLVPAPAATVRPPGRPTVAQAQPPAW